MQLHHLEIVTPEVDATCATYEQLHGVTFGDPEPGLGNARTAALASGGMIGVRAPMHETDESVVRPFPLKGRRMILRGLAPAQAHELGMRQRSWPRIS